MNDILLYEKVPPLEKKFPVKIRFQDKVGSLFMHWHEHLELLYFVKGCCDFNCDGKIFSVSAGDLVVVNSNEIHTLLSEKKVDYFYVLIYPQFFSDVDFENILLQNHIKNDEFIKTSIYEMYAEYEKGREGNDMQIKALTYFLMTYLMRNYTVERLSEHEYELRKAKHKRLNMILEYISEHYQENITTAHLAKMSFLSESYLCRFFKKSVGTSIVNYINELRVEKAAILLKNTEENITSIAVNVGFEDVNYFSRVFKKVKKMTPREFKNK